MGWYFCRTDRRAVISIQRGYSVRASGTRIATVMTPSLSSLEASCLPGKSILLVNTCVIFRHSISSLSGMYSTAPPPCRAVRWVSSRQDAAS